MPASADVLLVDTSVAVALVVADHDHHDAVWHAIADRRPGLSGHAAFETFSVLTRMPATVRRAPHVVGRLLAERFPETRHLGPAAAATLLDRIGTERLAGGQIYDALVGAAAVEHGLPLATRDRRALPVYNALSVHVELLG